MRCILCEKLSLDGICKICITKLLKHERQTRILDDGLRVYSFFSYDSIAPILHVKHHFFGHRILKQIAKKTYGNFAKEFHFNSPVFAIGIDDIADENYSHTAILAHAIKSESIKPLFGVLRASNKVKYSGQSYEFRRKNPRNFTVNTEQKEFNAILIDDIITSGQTIKQANKALNKVGINVLFALTLADAKS